MVKVAFVADSQVDERSRFEEHDRVMRFVAEDAVKRGCAALLHGGDVFERRSTERERDSVAEWIAAASASMEVYIVAGNHEAVGEVEELDARHGIDAWEIPNIVVSPGDFAIAFLPWPRRATLSAWIASRGGSASSADTDATATELLRDILRGFAAEFGKLPPDLPKILLGHVEVDGYTTDSDQPAVGGGMRLSVEDLMLAEADIVLLGHIHRPQEWIGRRADGAQVPVIYAGSPRRTAYAKGELVTKGYVVVEFDGRTPKWERIPTPATPMVLVESRWEDGYLKSDDGHTEIPRGAEVRLRYTVPSDERAAAAIFAQDVADVWKRAHGASAVQIEEIVLPTTRARAPEIAAETTVAGKLARLYELRGDVEPERVERLLALAGEIEAEVSL